MPTRFLYMESSPALKGKAKKFGASYRRMAVVEFDPAQLPEGASQPARIDIRCKGVVRIVAEAVESIGKTDRSYGYRVQAELKAEADRLNREAGDAA